MYNVLAVFEVRETEGDLQINDDEGFELQYFSLDKPKDKLNSFSEHLIRKAGYIKNW